MLSTRDKFRALVYGAASGACGSFGAYISMEQRSVLLFWGPVGRGSVEQHMGHPASPRSDCLGEHSLCLFVFLKPMDIKVKVLLQGGLVVLEEASYTLT